MSKSVNELALEFYALKQRKEELEDELKSVNLAYDRMRYKDIPDAMEAENIQTVTLGGGIGRLQLANDAWVRLTDPNAFYDWLKERGDYDGLVKPSIHPSTLKSYIKELTPSSAIVDYFKALKAGQEGDVGDEAVLPEGAGVDTAPPGVLFTPFKRASLVGSVSKSDNNLT